MKQERLVHMDLLRILACFSVVMLHGAAQFWYDLPVTGAEWQIVNSYNAIVRFGVPIFVMISGAIFLSSDKEINIKRLYTHNILRLAIIYFVWSAVYGVFDCLRSEWSVLSINDIMTEVYAGRYHLWYLPMIIGLYMLVPVLQKSLKHLDKKDVEYFLLLFLIIKIGKTTILSLISTEWMGFLFGVVGLDGILEYLGYFILGYYIARYGIEKKWHNRIYISGLAGAVINIVLSSYKAIQTDVTSAVVYDSFSLFTFFVVLAIFLFFHEKVGKTRFSARACKAIKEISMATLGIYLMHLAVLEALQDVGIHSMMVAPIIGVPLISVICFLLCLPCAAILRRLPFLGRYIC